MFMTWHDDVDYVGYMHNYLSPICNTMGFQNHRLIGKFHFYLR
jgi:hypothetical protein